MIQGPITGGKHGWAFGRPIFDLGTHGYVEDELFLSGDAITYRQVAGSEWGRDGEWQAEAKGSMPFKTRFVVYRPADPKRFNGTVVVCWNNVTAGYELFNGESPEFLEGGYAFVGASVQRAGVHGFPTNPQGLAVWDPQRYGELSIPSDEGSYDVYAQIGRAVGPKRDRSGIDPLGGLDVKNVIAVGASQSAGRLATYMNAIHPLGRVFDGFILQIYFGAGAPLEGDRMLVPSDGPGAPRRLIGVNLIRELDVPAMIVNSELEAIACYRVRQPDTARFVTWEFRCGSATSKAGKRRCSITSAPWRRRSPARCSAGRARAPTIASAAPPCPSTCIQDIRTRARSTACWRAFAAT